MKKDNQKENNEWLYSSLLEKKNGDLDEYSNYTSEIMRLCRLGFVKRGITNENKERFSVTELGMKQLRFMSVEDTLEEAMDGIIQFMS